MSNEEDPYGIERGKRMGKDFVGAWKHGRKICDRVDEIVKNCIAMEVEDEENKVVVSWIRGFITGKKVLVGVPGLEMTIIDAIMSRVEEARHIRALKDKKPKKKEKEDSEIMTVTETAKLLRVSDTIIEESFERGNIPGGRRIGKHGAVRFSKKVILDWLEEGEQ